MKPECSPDQLLECAVRAAREAGDYALRSADRRKEVLTSSRHDVKLRLDVECQERAESVIRAAYPPHAVLGEEDAGGASSSAPPAGYQWIIDPIDGTVNFFHGMPRWCCSIAVRRGEDVIAGAVYAPALSRLYTATAGGPAHGNGRVLRVSDVDALAGAMVLTGLDKNVRSGLPPFAVFTRIASHVQRPRVMGSAAVDICQVAAGQAEGYYESGIYLWDIAAAGLIVRQAGGRAEILAHQPGGSLQFLATNGKLHEELRSLVLET